MPFQCFDQKNKLSKLAAPPGSPLLNGVRETVTFHLKQLYFVFYLVLITRSVVSSLVLSPVDSLCVSIEQHQINTVFCCEAPLFMFLLVLSSRCVYLEEEFSDPSLQDLCESE